MEHLSSGQAPMASWTLGHRLIVGSRALKVLAIGIEGRGSGTVAVKYLNFNFGMEAWGLGVYGLGFRLVLSSLLDPVLNAQGTRYSNPQPLCLSCCDLKRLVFGFGSFEFRVSAS